MLELPELFTGLPGSLLGRARGTESGQWATPFCGFHGLCLSARFSYSLITRLCFVFKISSPFEDLLLLALAHVYFLCQ
jgi:hypothetical protein